MRFIILWEENPERIRMFDYESNDQQEIERIQLCHGKLINCGQHSETEEAALNYLNCRLMGQDLDGNVVSEPLKSFYDSNAKDCIIHISGDYQFVATGFVM